jgi:hypothetical protein
MPGLWKAWKAKGRLPTLSTSPLEISPTAGEISTFPQLRPRRRMEKWKTKSRFPTFPPPRFHCLKNKKNHAGGLRPRPRQRSRAASVVPFSSAPVVSCHSALDTSVCLPIIIRTGTTSPALPTWLPGKSQPTILPPQTFALSQAQGRTLRQRRLIQPMRRRVLPASTTLTELNPSQPPPT